MRAYYKGMIPEDKIFKGQGKLIMDALGEHDSPKSTTTLSRDIADKLITRQPVERVVAFYMSVWLKKGYVKFVDLSEPSGGSGDENVSTPKATPREVRHESVLPDLGGKKLSEAVLAVLEFKARALDVREITQVLNDHGYDFQTNQVQSAVQNLVKKEAITKVGDKVALAA